MAVAKKSIEIDASRETVFAVIADYESYPELMPDLETAEVHSRSDGVVEASFSVNLIKRVSYTLRLEEKAPETLRWSQVRGPFKQNDGGWTLHELGPGRTRADYQIELRVSGFVPRAISNRLVEGSLPALLQSVKAAAEAREA